jgi:hypothetical protein
MAAAAMKGRMVVWSAVDLEGMTVKLLPADGAARKAALANR